jgi:hypothetical protein
MRSVFELTSEYDNPQVLVPLANKENTELLLEYFEPRNLICMNINREKLFEINGGCFRLPANFLREGGRRALIPGAFDLAYLPGIPSYWYISYNYVRKGGYLVGGAVASDKRFENWMKALSAENGMVKVL